MVVGVKCAPLGILLSYKLIELCESFLMSDYYSIMVVEVSAATHG